jgi:hypothetical protein
MLRPAFLGVELDRGKLLRPTGDRRLVRSSDEAEMPWVTEPSEPANLTHLCHDSARGGRDQQDRASDDAARSRGSASGLRRSGEPTRTDRSITAIARAAGVPGGRGAQDREAGVELTGRTGDKRPGVSLLSRAPPSRCVFPDERTTPRESATRPPTVRALSGSTFNPSGSSRAVQLRHDPHRRRAFPNRDGHVFAHSLQRQIVPPASGSVVPS